MYYKLYLVSCTVLQAVFGWVALYYKLFLNWWHCITNLSLGGWHCITSCIWSVALYYKPVFGWVALYYKLYLVSGTVLQAVFDWWHCITSLSLGGWHCITSCLWMGGILLQAVFGWGAIYYKLYLISGPLLHAC